MKQQRKPIPKRRHKPRRKRPGLFHRRKREFRFLDPRSHVTKGGRFRLFGEDYRNLHDGAYYRAAAGRDWYGVTLCECGCGKPAFLFSFFGGLNDTGELSHNEHGSRKSDELNRVKWMRHECHMKSHNCGGKPVPKKAA